MIWFGLHFQLTLHFQGVPALSLSGILLLEWAYEQAIDILTDNCNDGWGLLGIQRQETFNHPKTANIDTQLQLLQYCILSDVK